MGKGVVIHGGSYAKVMSQGRNPCVVCARRPSLALARLA